MTKSGVPPILSVGAVVDSDAESRAWQREIAALGKRVMAARGEADAPLRVNVVFHVDSSFTPNEFEGVRTGRFSKKDSHLQVQAAVPVGPSEDRRRVLLELLSAAVDEAEDFARRRGIAQDLHQVRGVAAAVSSE